jgi:cytochrome P450
VGSQVIRGVDTLANTLAQPDAHGDQLTEGEIAAYFTMLLFVGNNHPRNAISSSVLALLEHPEQLELLRSEPRLLRPTKSSLAPVALEELLRWSTPVNYLARTATKDTTIEGVDVKAGDRVVMWYAAASRDTEMFPGADRLDVGKTTRDPAHYCAHYAFGHGPHFCQGDRLTYRIVSTALRGILSRLPGLRLAGPAVHERSPFVNALTSLPVTFNRADPATARRRENELIQQLERLTGKKVILEG